MTDPKDLDKDIELGNEEEEIETERVKVKENVKFSPDDTFTSEDGGDQSSVNEEHAKEAKLKATPAVFKRRQATKHLVVQSPTDRNFSPCSQKLLQKKRVDRVEKLKNDDF